MKDFYAFQDDPDFDPQKKDPFFKKFKLFRQKRNRPEDASILLEHLLNHPNLRDKNDLLTLNRHFVEIVGATLAARISIADLKQKKLFLKVPQAVLKSEIFLQKKAIIERCNSVLQKPAIIDICFV
ncbi:MAG: DUF721 domain-containing protein [Fibrobacter sp.]|jgi:hypothetical protein|nr:DUF721 domain-containing protein [Fibrobacter sp.]